MKLFQAEERTWRLGDKKGTRIHKEVTSRWAGGVKKERLWRWTGQIRVRLETCGSILKLSGTGCLWDTLEKQTSKVVVGGRILPVRIPQPLRAAPDSYWGASGTHGNLHSEFHACGHVLYKVTDHKVLHEWFSSSLSVQGAKAKEPWLALDSSPKKTFQSRVLYLQFI